MKKITIALLAILYVIPSFSQTMEWHIKDNYVDVKYMGNNLFKVKNSNGKWGVINEYGETTVAIQYDSITPIVENRALLLDNTGQFLRGIINEKGQILNTSLNSQMSDNKIFISFPSFNEGMLAYGVEAGNYYLFEECQEGYTSLVDPWLSLHAANAGAMGSIPSWGTKTPHAMQHGQKIKKKKNEEGREFRPLFCLSVCL